MDAFTNHGNHGHTESNFDIEDVIEDIFGENITNDQKEELFNLLLHISNKYSKIISNEQPRFDDGYYNFLPNYIQNSRSLTPSINIFLFNPSQNLVSPQPIGYYPPYMINNAHPIQTQQVIQNPNFIYYNQPPFMNTIPITKTDKIEYTKNYRSKKSKHDKSSSNSKSSKSDKHDKKHKKKSKKDDKKDATIQSFPYNGGTDFNGIINYLTNKTGGNIHENGTIEVKSNSIYNTYHPKNILDLKNNNFYATEVGEKNATVTFDFKSMEIEISNYSIKSSSCGPGDGHIKSWVIEISKDGKEWTKIDEHQNSSELNGCHKIRTFAVNKKKFVRFCRFRHLGEYWMSNQTGCHLIIVSIEFYGRLKNCK